MIQKWIVIELGREIIKALDSIKSKLDDLEDILRDMNRETPEEVGRDW